MTLAIAFIAVVLVILAFVYFAILRPWQLRWGSTDEEISRSMPGDDIVARPTFNATRAVTISASQEDIYPWIAQMGLNRAGWYSYGILDNLGRRSADRIIPELQEIEIGDLIPMSPDGKKGLWVKDFQTNKWMLWWDKKGDSTWAWMIYADGDLPCRLVTRVRVKYRWLSPLILFNLIIEFFDIIMMRKCMLGIKKRAESERAEIS